jgi:hypothetical protein
MKKIYTLASLFHIIILSAQVGIGTIAPVEQIHIAGSNSTVRVEGLNAANNSLNNGTQGNSRVFVNSNGDLVLGTKDDNLAVLFNPNDYLKSDEASPSTFVQTGTGSGYQYVGEANASGEGNAYFTLTKNAIVELNYAVSWKLQKGGGGNKLIQDGNARIVQSYVALFRWNAGAGSWQLVTTDLDSASIGLLGLSGQYHANNDEGGGAEYFYNNGTDYVKLPPGIYLPRFAVQVAVSATNGYGAIKFVIGGKHDEMQAIAHYYN